MNWNFFFILTEKARSLLRPFLHKFASYINYKRYKYYDFDFKTLGDKVVNVEHRFIHRHLDIIQKGVTAWNEWRELNPDIKPDLREADLNEADLNGADLSGAHLNKCNLSNAKLSEANLIGAYLIGAYLIGADLSKADLSGCHLSEANLNMADLSDANLSRTDLSGANLIRADLSGANLSRTNLNRANLNLSNLSGVFSKERADISHAKLNQANLNNANLRKADFCGSELRKAKLFKAFLIEADLSGANLQETDLHRSELSKTNLRGADLSRANLHKANLNGCDLSEAILIGADLSEANLIEEAKLCGTDLSEADLRNAYLMGADLSNAKLIGADLSGADLSGANLLGTDLSEANLAEANLNRANLIETNFEKANLKSCRIYGISAWNLKLGTKKENNLAIQDNLIITRDGESTITVDNLEVAQFIYLLIKNEKIRDIIDTIGKKGVLILGRFTPERKIVLDSIRTKLRQENFAPIIFDFEKPPDKDFTETIMILAGMCRFVIVDLTDPKSSPLELQATIPNYMIPFVPIIKEGEKPFSMFQDLLNKNRDRVLDILPYDSIENLVLKFKNAVIKPALEKHAELMVEKNKELKYRNLNNYS